MRDNNVVVAVVVVMLLMLCIKTTIAVMHYCLLVIVFFGVIFMVASCTFLNQQESWSIGLEWDLIEYVLDVYLMLVLGEGRFPVNTNNPNGSSSSSSSSSSNTYQINSNNSISINGAPHGNKHSARSDWPKKVLLVLPQSAFTSVASHAYNCLCYVLYRVLYTRLQ
jgi:hypothetical protein